MNVYFPLASVVAFKPVSDPLTYNLTIAPDSGVLSISVNVPLIVVSSVIITSGVVIIVIVVLIKPDSN